MDAYIDNQRIVIGRIQAERRAEAGAQRLAAGPDRDQAARRRAKRLLVAAFCVVVALAGLTGTGLRFGPGLLPDAGVAPVAGLP